MSLGSPPPARSDDSRRGEQGPRRRRSARRSADRHPEPLWILGSGGHAKVVIETARAGGHFEPVGALDDAPERLGAEVLGVPVVGTIDMATVVRVGAMNVTAAVGANSVRLGLTRRLATNVRWVTLVHPTAVVAPTARLGEGTVVFAGAVIQPDALVGRHVIVNTGASVDHDCVVRDYAHLAPGVRLAGNVTVDDGALLGICACAIPGCRIGRWATVGAGGVVVRDVPERTVVRGVPARQPDAPSGELR